MITDEKYSRRMKSVTPMRIRVIAEEEERPEFYRVERKFNKRSLFNEGGFFSYNGRKPQMLEPLSDQIERKRNSISTLKQKGNESVEIYEVLRQEP